MAKHKQITEKMELSEAIEISRTFPLETLLLNVRAKGGSKSLTLRRGAEEALALCAEPNTMHRLVELLFEDLSGNIGLLGPIHKRLAAKQLTEEERVIAIAELSELI